MEKIFTYSKRVDEIPMKFPEKMWLTIILKVTKKKQSFIHSLEDKVLEKFTGGWGGGCQFDPLSLFRVNHGLYFRASMYS